MQKRGVINRIIPLHCIINASTWYRSVRRHTPLLKTGGVLSRVLLLILLVFRCVCVFRGVCLLLSLVLRMLSRVFRYVFYGVCILLRLVLLLLSLGCVFLGYFTLYYIREASLGYGSLCQHPRLKRRGVSSYATVPCASIY